MPPSGAPTDDGGRDVTVTEVTHCAMARRNGSVAGRRHFLPLRLGKQEIVLREPDAAVLHGGRNYQLYARDCA